MVIDEGAYRAVGRRESGGRLLPAGVVRVEGPFASHQAVRIVVRRKRRFPPAPLLTYPESEAVTPSRMSPEAGPSSIDMDHIMSPLAKTVITAAAASVGSVGSSPDSAPQPGTPLIYPTLSLSSSVASLDPLSRTAPTSPAIRAVTDRLAVTSITGELQSNDADVGAAVASAAAAVAHAHVAAEDEWEEVEVGKGLAQYNSLEIDRIKGMKSRHIEQVLGYSESEHVVESIALL